MVKSKVDGTGKVREVEVVSVSAEAGGDVEVTGHGENCSLEQPLDARVPDTDSADGDIGADANQVAKPAERSRATSPSTEAGTVGHVPDTDTEMTKVQPTLEIAREPDAFSGAVGGPSSFPPSPATSVTRDGVGPGMMMTPEERRAQRKVRASMKRHRMSMVAPPESPWIELPTPKALYVNRKQVARPVGLSASVGVGGGLVEDSGADVVELEVEQAPVTLESLLPFFTCTRVVSFEEGLTFPAPGRPAALLSSLRKIAEASYSEVYEATVPDPIDKKGGDTRCVVKVVPVAGDVEINGGAQLTLDQVAAEVVCTSAVCNVGPGFVRLVRSFVARGRYPKKLLDEWDKFEKTRGSENDRPDFLPTEQLYMVLVLEHAGTDLEHYKVRSWKESESLFIQLALALAAAEEKVQFEHRDLHWGNVMILPSKSPGSPVTWRLYPSSILPLASQSPGIARAGVASVSLPSAGVEARIIDYTLSRCLAGGRVWFNDMADDDLFKGQGDRQFDVYREMLQHTEKDWHGFHPKTNMMWLEYILDKLLNSREKKPPTLRGKAKVEEDAAKARLQEVALRARGCADVRELLKKEWDGWCRIGLSVGRSAGRTSSI
ncbi:hypothetical protein M427DRAFT_138350 [Gonapodya prolifera JEL478]|uniref:non-specific serine/threonine protein kinase n=1 Tax=Gonapodya prolifera (strain JEL478) TaxID=1344416 RepID=A0A139A4G6_GONPJ|nr:hypothetical protein M427DRAFT_138350 [Gonapodya prolifera JEL478]|eukprot:KXS11253.1 hypothetical protein M427DRAFT_138350 [Gonapodya prolifera JEL478]